MNVSQEPVYSLPFYNYNSTTNSPYNKKVIVTVLLTAEPGYSDSFSLEVYPVSRGTYLYLGWYRHLVHTYD